MSTSSSASSPSSSAVTIPIPGKSILKKPPPPQTSLFSRITRFLPQSQSSGSTFGIRSSTSGSGASPSTGNGNGGSESNGNAPDDGGPLKRAHFILPQIATVYPISSLNPPSTPTLKEEKRAIEEREAERRRRIVRGSTSSTGSGTPIGEDDWWSMDKVCSFYEECCAGCDEPPDPAIKAAFKNAANTNPRTVDLSGIQLTFISASILADVFTIEWGLRKLVFRECDLDEHILKPLLHSLLISNSLTFLSVASNRRLKTPAFRLIGAYVTKATSLQFLDLSQIPLDKKSIEYIVAALTQPPIQGLASLRLDDCSLKPGALDVLARAVRTSSLRNISLRHNKINATGAIALSVMIRDYPDSIPASGLPPSAPQTASQTSLLLSPTSTITTTTSLPGSSSTAIGTGTGTPSSSLTPSPASSVTSLPLTSSMAPNAPPTSPQQPHAGPVLPPPTHPSLQPVQTTYTPYVPRAKRGKTPSTTSTTSPALGNVPIITTSARGGVTAVTANGVSAGVDKVVSAVKSVGSQSGRTPPGRSNTYNQGPSAALLDKVRALDSLPRLGSLRTLDLKGNDLRNGTTYLAQVLKRNRTLKVLNLSENKLDVACLVAIADALKYNTCLETLDLSRNPCCGSGSSSGSGSLTKDRDRLTHGNSTLSRSDKPSELEGIQSLRTSLTLTTSLKRLFLSSTNLNTQGAIALAEFLPESRSLLHLDLTGNDDLGVAGVMALNEGLKRNRVMRCLDLEVPPGAEEYTRLCREILNTCIRNTEEAEKTVQQEQAQGYKSKATLWGMIEESELAKSVRFAGDDVGMIDTDVVLRARGCIRLLNNYVKNPSIPLYSPQSTPSRTISPPLSPQTPVSGVFSPTTTTFSSFSLLSSRNQSSPTKEDPPTVITPEELIQKSQGVIKELGMVITSGQDDVGPERLEELLGLNDELTGLTTKAEQIITAAHSTTPATPITTVGGGRQGRPALTLQGLGLKFHNSGNGEGASINGSGPSTVANEEASSPTTPKIDKGKRRAEPEPIEHEKVLSPTASFLISESNSDDEDDDDEMRSKFPPVVIPGTGDEDYGLEAGEDPQSPSSTDRSRIWVEEEGEVFRKGNVLLGPEEMEGEYAGEDLRRELLEAMVERPAPRTLSVDEFGVELPPEEAEAPPAPLPTEPSKPQPRPYISRRSSSSSIMSLVSPTVEKAAALPLPASPKLDSKGTYFQGSGKSPLSPTVSSPIPGTPTRETGSPRPYVPRMRASSNLDTK